MGCSFAFRPCCTFLLIVVSCGGSAWATVLTTGDVTPGGGGLQPDPWGISGKLKIGEFGSGTLSVQAGGTVLNDDTGTIGHYLGATGVATVTGTDSIWDNDQNLIVGLSGSGVLNVTNGGKLLNKSYASAGYYTNASGEITISGTDSSWDNRGALYLGTRGSGTLNVEAGGLVSNSSDGYLGQLPGASGLATVTGEGSRWNSGDDLWIGGKESAVGGTGTLNIYNGGLVTVTDMTRLWDTGTLNLDGGTLTTGSFDNSDAGTFNFYDGVLNVNGLGGLFTPGTNSFSIDGDGADDFPELAISNTANFAVPGGLKIGVNERGQLKAFSGGGVASSYGYLGYSNGSTGQVTISGANSKWENSAYLYVGDSSSGTITIEDGGRLENGEVSSIGYLSSATGVVTVTGAESLWNNTGILNVGDGGTGTLNITDGGMVSSPALNFIGLDNGSTGHATVAGTGSQWLTPKLYLGERGNGTLNVEAGGVVTNESVFIGTYPGGIGVATVAGADSKWISSGFFNVGWSGSGSLHIEDSGFVSTADSFLATQSDGTAEATVTGTGSHWNNSGDFNLGVSGSATLNVTDGGLVSDTDGYLGYHADGIGLATVTGIGSSWSHSNNLHAGHNGTGTLNITAGGVVSNVDGYIGHRTDGTGTVTVTGIGSTWNNLNNLHVGRDGTGILNVADGGLVTVGSTTSIGTSATVNLTGGRFEFGQTSLEEFSTITASSGSMAGNLRHDGYTAASSLTSLQNSAVDLTEVTLTNSGVLYGNAALGTALINTFSGEVEAMPAERLRFAGAGNTNTGEINNFGGQIRFEQDLTNLPDGMIEGRGQFVANGGWMNSGVMFFTGTTDILGDVVNEKSGQIVSSGSGTTTF
ncbi:MAG: hypothetical protein MK161_13150, partial [Pirellulales bacterium]|nr:hypothetical protein [Pirellulales bacterium]